MKLKGCYIRRFGTLSDRSFSFPDGITLISGRNESGKSTLHTAIAALLFGMERGKGRAAAGGTYRMHLPWSEPDLYGGAIRWEREGIAVQAARDFSKTPPQSRITLEEDGTEKVITQEEIPFPDGLTAAVFANTLSFRQVGAATGDGLAADLKNHIMNLKSSGDENLNVYAAIDVLKARRKAMERRIDTAAEAEDASLDREILDLESRTLEGGGDYEALQQEADAQDARIRALTAEREKADRELKQKELLLTNMGTTSRETVENDLRRSGVLCEQLDRYETEYAAGAGKGFGALSFLMLFVTVAALIFMNRLIQNAAPFWLLIPLFVCGLLSMTVFARLTRQADADLADKKNRELLMEMLSVYLPDYQAKGTLKEATETRTYLEKVLQLFDYLAEKRRVFDEDTEELVRLSASREAKNSELTELLRMKVRREQWELSLRKAMAKKEALKPVLEENERLRSEVAAIAQAVSALSALAENSSHSFGRPLTAAASEIFAEVTGGAYDGLEIDENLELLALSGGRKIAPGALSAGAMEQLYFAFRLAVIRFLWPEEDMPLFFDDSFAMYDSERLEACLNWLHQNYRGQVFLFTCQDRERKTLDKLDIPYCLLEL